MSKSLPVSIFIVGAAKAGTTSLHAVLDRHPDVFMSDPKETNYFSHRELKIQNLFYKERCVSSMEEYNSLYSHALPGQLLGEASVSYLLYPEVAGRIHQYNSCAKIIVSLRDPVERAISHYLMDCRLGHCKVPLSEILENPKKHPLFFQQYFENGLYYKLLKSYFDTFPAENILVISSDDLNNSPDPTLDRVYSFLGLESPDDVQSSARENTYKELKNSWYASLYQQRFLRKLVKAALPRSLLDKLRSRIFSDGEKPSWPSATIETIHALYQDDIFHLEKLLDRRFIGWHHERSSQSHANTESMRDD